MMKIRSPKEASETVGSHWSLLSCIHIGDTSEKAAGVAICSWSSFWVEGGGRFLNMVLIEPHHSYEII